MTAYLEYLKETHPVDFLYVCWIRKEDKTLQESFDTLKDTKLELSSFEEEALNHTYGIGNYWLQSPPEYLLHKRTLGLMETCRLACKDSIENLERLTAGKEIQSLETLKFLKKCLERCLVKVTSRNFYWLMTIAKEAKIPSSRKFNLDHKELNRILKKEYDRLLDHLVEYPASYVKKPLWNQIGVIHPVTSTLLGQLEPIFDMCHERCYPEFIRKAQKLGIKIPVVDRLDLL